MNLHRLTAIAYKEWREVMRDRLFTLMAFGIPVVTLLVLAFGISQDVENIPFAALDQDHSQLSRDYLHLFMDSRYFHFQGEARNERQLADGLADGRIRLALVIPPHFAKRLRQNRPVAVQSLIDGMFTYRAQVIRGYVSAINHEYNESLLLKHFSTTFGLSPERAKALADPVILQERYLYNQAILSRWSMSSGLIMLVLMFAPPFLTALGVVREKEHGSIYNIYSATVSHGEFILGKLLPYVAISTINVMVLWWLVILVFGTPFKGSLVFYLPASLVFVICTTGIGLLVSLLVRTQAAAALLTIVITFIPAMLFSGLLVPIESMSAEARFETHLFPAVYFLHAVWGVFLKGLGWRGLWEPVAALTVYAMVIWIMGLMLFHKRPKR